MQIWIELLKEENKTNMKIVVHHLIEWMGKKEALKEQNSPFVVLFLVKASYPLLLVEATYSFCTLM